MAFYGFEGGLQGTASEVHDFVASLNLDKNATERTISALSVLPRAKWPTLDEDKEEKVAIGVYCKVAEIIFGPNALLEQPVIKKAASKSCGGHSPNPAWSSVQEGVLIDLGKLNGIAISEDRKTASIGPGARWGDVYEFLDPYDVTVIGGRAPQVGVGGLMLGGGISFFTGEYGLAVDNIKNIEIVLADGSIVNANHHERSDLFWALKGGGPNFGIVTRYDLEIVPVKNIWYQSMVYGPDKAHEILDAFALWQESLDTKASVALIMTPSAIVVGLVHIEPVERPAVFEPFYNIPLLVTAVPSTIGTVLALSKISGAGMESTFQRHDYCGASSAIDAQLCKDVYDFCSNQVIAVQAATGANITFVLQHIPKNVVDKGNACGGNALGLEPVAQQWWTTILDWNDAADDETVRNAAIATAAKWEELGKARGLHLPFLYMNDASRDQDPLSTFPAKNVEKLRAVARKYDPLGVFQTLQSGGFLLSKMS